MTFLILLPVYALRITHVQGFKRLLQTTFIIRYDDQVNVVGHQAIAQYAKAEALAVRLSRL